VTEDKESKTIDTSLDKLLTMSPKEINDLLADGQALEGIARDQRHVQILVYHMIRFNIIAINDFNRVSTRASNVLIFLSVVMTIIVLVQLLLVLVQLLLLVLT
jgi:hypothetical protein